MQTHNFKLGEGRYFHHSQANQELFEGKKFGGVWKWKLTVITTIIGKSFEIVIFVDGGKILQNEILFFRRTIIVLIGQFYRKEVMLDKGFIGYNRLVG